MACTLIPIRTLLITACTAGALLCATGGAPASGTTPPMHTRSIEPVGEITSLAGTVKGIQSGTRIAGTILWQTPEYWSFRSTRTAPDQFEVGTMQNGGARYFLNSDFTMSVDKRTYAGEPDGFQALDMTMPQMLYYALAKGRENASYLATTTFGGVPAYVASTRVPANDCAGLAKGVATIWIDTSTLAPLKYVEKRRKSLLSERFTWTAVNPTLVASDFLPPARFKATTTTDFRFRRSSVATADARLPYTPQLPVTLPTGFALAETGWAAKSQATGPEASIEPQKNLFVAVYRRGFERISVTERVGNALGIDGWAHSDPFAGECSSVESTQTVVSGASATYARGVTIVPHLYWRRGGLLLTVSGPFPRADLVQVAESLAPAA